MNKYEPTFFTTKRKGKTALWVVLPDGVEQNIGDVTSLTKDMETIIPFVFRLGMRSMLQQVKRIDSPTLYTTDDKFEVRCRDE